MKSKTSFFNKTVFQKDLTRFAPAWGACAVLMLLALIGMADRGYAYYRLQNVRDSIVFMSWLNLIYAAVVAQLIFGDLFNARLCNALHALPLRRECWYGSHVVSGFAFSLLPNVVIVLLALPILRLETGWVAVFWWLLACELQYLFFFGIAVLCVMLSGNRLGQLALYAMIQFAGLLAYWMISMIYEPFLHGIQFSEEPFMLVCPLARIANMNDILVIDHERIENALGELEYYRINSVTPGDGWGYLAICAGVGILALVAALMLYRKRKLECSGDFVAYVSMEPVVTVIVTIFAGVFFHLFADAFGMNLRSVMLCGGMVIGFFACRMLLERTTRVFRKKAFFGCGAIILVFGLTVLLTYLDPAGITRYVPEREEVESITFSQTYSLSSHSDFPYVATSAADIEALQQVHAGGIDRSSEQPQETSDEVYNTFTVRLEYKLKNGRTVNRFYEIHPKSEAGIILKDYFTTTEFVLGVPQEQILTLAPYIRSIYTEGREQNQYDLEGLDLEGLLKAVADDCAAGNMAQSNGYHYPSNYSQLDNMEIDGIVAYLELGFDRELMQVEMKSHAETASAYGYGSISVVRFRSLRVYRSCVNTLKWMEDNGLLTEDMQKAIDDPATYFAKG